MGKQREMSRLQTILMSVLVSLVLLNFGALAYFRDALSARDYSAIPDPQLRVGYCMMSSMTLPDTYLLAETIAHPPSFEVYRAVMSLSTQATERPEVRIAMSALKARNNLRARAHSMSTLIAFRCGYWKVKWPDGVSPLDVNFKWHRFDPTFWNFVNWVKTQPDAAERLYKATRKKQVILAQN